MICSVFAISSEQSNNRMLKGKTKILEEYRKFRIFAFLNQQETDFK